MCEWYANKDRTTAIASVPKAASTSISNSGNYVRLGLMDIPKRIAFIRDPIERLKSGFFFFRDVPLPALTPHRYHTARWESFIDIAIFSNDNHFRPQAEQLTDKGVFVPNLIYPFTRIGELFKSNFGCDLPHARKSDKPDVAINVNYRREEIETRFAKDYELLRSC